MASGVRLRVEELGNGPPIVLLHGLFVDKSSWEPVIDDLSDSFRVIAPDLPGSGHSEKPKAGRYSYGIPAFAEAVCDLYGALGIGRATVVGHGLGGAVALTLAARHGELVAKLVLVDALCYRTRLDPARRVALVPVLGGFVLKQLWSRSTFRSVFRRTMLSREANVPSERIDRYYDLFNTPAARASALATLRATVDTRAVVADVARVVAPTLVLWGNDDSIYPPSFAQRLARELQNARLRMVDAGHAPHEERPHEVAQAIREFAAT